MTEIKNSEVQPDVAMPGLTIAIESDGTAVGASQYWEMHPGAWSRYAPLKERISSFRLVPPENKARAWSLLESWAEQVHKLSGKPLPPPFVFGGRTGYVELEWELPDRDLWITVPADGPIEYALQQRKNNRLREEEGSRAEGAVDDLLLWLVSE